MPMLPLNGTQLRVRLVDLELDRLKLDPDNPRLHSAYLTHALPSRPQEKQLLQVLEALPEFQALLDAISRNHGCFQPPLVTMDGRVLEGNRRARGAAQAAGGRPAEPALGSRHGASIDGARDTGTGARSAREVPFGTSAGMGWFEPTHGICRHCRTRRRRCAGADAGEISPRGGTGRSGRASRAALFANAPGVTHAGLVVGAGRVMWRAGGGAESDDLDGGALPLDGA